MSEQTNAYDAEVRRIADIISYTRHGHTHNSGEYENSAKAIVAEMAKQYEFAYFSNYHGDEDSEDYALWNRNCIYEMQERGLIPMT